MTLNRRKVIINHINSNLLKYVSHFNIIVINEGTTGVNASFVANRYTVYTPLIHTYVLII